MAPVRVQLRRTKGWKMPPNTVKVDRSTQWGNPYIIERMVGRELWDAESETWVRRLFSVRLLGGPFHYEAYIRSRDAAARRACKLFAEEIAPSLDLAALRGKNLGCWCALYAPCHADVLLELANRPEDA